MTEGAEPEVPRKNGQLDEEAARWFARMRGPDAETSRPEFERWLARGALHLTAYNRAGELWSMGKFLSDESSTEGVPLELRTSGPEPGPESDRDAMREHDKRRRFGPKGLAIAAGIAGLLGMAGWHASGWNGPPAKQQIVRGERRPGGDMVAVKSRYETIKGETRTVRLFDGSSVTLKPNSVLDVAFDAKRRYLRLERGEGRFNVAHDRRAFVVAAGRGTVTAHGTLFDVQISADNRVIVRLLQGSIAVAMPSGSRSAKPTEAVRRLSAGEQIEFSDATQTAAPTPASSDSQAIAPIEFADTPLEDVVTQANRTSLVQIRIDPALADKRVSGRFRIDDGHKLAVNLASMLGLRVEKVSPTEIRLRSK